MDEITSADLGSYFASFQPGGRIVIQKPIIRRIKELITRPRINVISGVIDYGNFCEMLLEEKRISWPEWRAEAISILHDCIDVLVEEYERELLNAI
ncbi:MAG: hypothetical protein H0X02_04865 [Nitrosomonas sp.]|nr:hypothetical protein [Nitrosomonas sp.]